MIVEARYNPSFLGPHEGREFELMKAGTKPLAMFIHHLAPDDEKFFAEDSFDKLVAAGTLKKFERIEEHQLTNEQQTVIRRVLYALPSEEWRIPAFLFIHDYYASVTGFRADMERLIGTLLGYEPTDVDKYISHHGISRE